jgi:stage II sporulation protein D
VISAEPLISAGVIDHAGEVHGAFNGSFELQNSIRLKGAFKVISNNNRLVLYDDENIEVARASELQFRSIYDATFTLSDVIIGKNFHWEKKEDQTFNGDVQLLASDGLITVINKIGIESYLKSVISSEMSSEAPIEFLKAHAITSRSWLVAMLERKKNFDNISAKQLQETENEIIRWYDREDHLLFDVCADDHCQRYRGITKIISKSAEEAVNATRGTFLVYDDRICDARFSKACGGRTELFGNCWEDTPVPYLQSVSDSNKDHSAIITEPEAESWILSAPDVFCNTSDGKILKQILPSFDRETTDFFRWKVEYTREQLEEIIRLKSGIDFGTISDIVPIQRGPSGRIFKLKIVGTKCTITVGKELEIRRWLSKSHLYSSAFIIKIKHDENGFLKNFTFYGAGWGHGVGLCQIGAAVMAIKGFKAGDILKHYFAGVEIRNLYG